ncbi:sugar ABC transporter substrate-binding protein [Ideonella sp. BN130291]|uniref:sugar ABC transporter substrate-binding protein n=1 Tax=Ideonella sp. BN130291 TaxID=3112940 RepID=UPI002E2706F9|nr:sugar ABC transporter substrate-binding protein [Ideonella sp. BN130291]
MNRGRPPGAPDAARRQWLRAAAVAGLPTLGACAPSAKDRTLRFWAMGREGEVVTELLPDFQRENPGLRVRVEQLPWTAAHEKLLTAFAGDATPDLAQMGNTWLPEMDALRALAPLTEWVDTRSAVPAADHFPGIWQTNLIGQRLVGIPWYVDTRLLFYRSDLLRDAGFDAPPRTWDEWRRMQQALHQGTVRTPMLLPLNEFEPLLALALQQGEPLLREGGRFGNFSSAGFRRALGFYLQMFERGWAPPANNNEVANVSQEFARGRFAFYITGPWNIGEFRRRLPAGMQGRWNTAPLPGPDGPGASTAGGSSLVIFQRSKRKADAARLVEYLCRPTVQQRFYALTGNLPPRRSSWQAPALAGDPQARAFAEQLERVVPAPAVPEWERIAQEMQQFAERAVRQGLPVEGITDALDQRVNGFLEKRRWMLARSGRKTE